MNKEQVYSLHRVYRKVLDAMARPGTIQSLQEESAMIRLDGGCLPAAQCLIQLLLDADTTFCAFSADEALERKISQLTYCPIRPLEKAAYVLVTKSVAAALPSVIEQVSGGTLEDPQLGATLIVECSALKSGGELVLKGPGIQEAVRCQIETRAGWIEARAEKNAEFPLGVDLIFVDPKGQLLCLPRTTQISKEAEAWPM
ncbi:phosphonate C-P lyase system protein PhnH [Holdemania massiliensis]|uniref:Phosphonate C-P lyase system protein PhnH n=1 Tax=Holdemania massiliensis TaxID=1468449 RepID=A0A6N7S2Q5_9FIRM|nr:phosphonate C-P lyase system protein PhnH [Holdemania massiliensis]MSA70312.1 phosphonate C-P lyase system protein PhnH [Holdemania massiliensis]MSA88157.1 phosphonate C-P lyase system protein PhnH [Holdemania massiliensis]MSB76986.1 phosphonate C-P lyase system protein PhnH [Holdemania massiliensis]MSC31912.1 phosphonate C-P lyase system protein PhnH [Holdemania massiliensis]MSC38232.1 phosphonate C-P lyase system protein PhnH [Holdemania massiliensis]